MVWNNADVALFHGTNTTAHNGPTTLYSSYFYSVNLSLCRANSDFGRGYYTTTSRHQATQWANDSVRKSAQGAKALILRFNVDRDSMAGLDTLTFVRPSQDYYDLVSFCRTGGRPHARKVQKLHYDVVYGPVALGLQKLTIQDSDQISFHTAQATACLCANPVVVYDLATAASGLLP